jgi:hypothetical protein
MADVLRPEEDNNLATFPGPSKVKLDANVNGELGKMHVTVSGYGKVPAAANAATGVMRGVITDGNDNTGGAQGAKSVICRPGVYWFKNSAGNACTQATVGAKVYAEDGETISSNSADGPPAGILKEFDSTRSDGRYCKVALLCVKI